VLATQVRQKDSLFYFVNYAAQDLLNRVRFVSRFYGEGGQIRPEDADSEDDIVRFITRVERSDGAFQRELSRAKVRALQNFYETAISQPPIPGTLLLFTNESLAFTPLSNVSQVGNLSEPRERFLIIDGQHRLAALHFYLQKKPEEADSLHIPCILFDGHSEDFATEMFVIINSTPTRINKSHLIDLYEKVSWAEPDRKFAARIADALYSAPDSPLRYRINRLGGRSQKEKWILQAELFNELHRWVRARWQAIERAGTNAREVERHYRVIRDFLKAAQKIFGVAWGNNTRFMVTRPVALKALIRVAADLAESDREPEEGRVERWEARLAPWRNLVPDFRTEGFYERYAAKGQVERVAILHRHLNQSAHIPSAVKPTAGKSRR
jgi:DGQHR domain-containing protein